MKKTTLSVGMLLSIMTASGQCGENHVYKNFFPQGGVGGGIQNEKTIVNFNLELPFGNQYIHGGPNYAFKAFARSKDELTNDTSRIFHEVSVKAHLSPLPKLFRVNLVYGKVKQKQTFANENYIPWGERGNMNREDWNEISSKTNTLDIENREFYGIGGQIDAVNRMNFGIMLEYNQYFKNAVNKYDASVRLRLSTFYVEVGTNDKGNNLTAGVMIVL